MSQSPFYRLERRSDLARLLRLAPIELTRIMRQRDTMYITREQVVGTKNRSLAIPSRALRRCHERIYELLRRIRLPDFILSPRRNTSPTDNVLLHRASSSITSFDIKAFYPSTTDQHIIRFFRDRMQMSPDCAQIMSHLCTHEGRLPLGSPMSPHLACLVHLDLFEDAALRGEQLGYKTSVWVDDVAISGPANRRDLVGMIRRKAHAKGLEIHKLRRGGGNRGLELTGAYLRKNKVAVANSSHLRIRDLTQRLQVETDPVVRHGLLNRLAAMARHQRMILRRSGEDTIRIDGRLEYYRREMRRLQQSLTVTEPKIRVRVDDPTLPAF